MSEQYQNLATSTSTGTLDNTTNPLTVVVGVGDGAKFPATTNGPFRITVCDATGTNAEVMLVTSRATDTMTATRGAWSATAGAVETPTPTLSTHSAGSIVAHLITAGAEDQIRKDMSRTTFSGSLPLDGRQGDKLYPTDDCVVSIHNGAAFIPGMVGFPLRGNPNAQTWQWYNQGTSVVTARSQSIHLVGQAGASAFLSARTHAVPATPYAIVATVILWVPNATFAHAGIMFTDGTKVSEFDVITDSVTASKISHFSSGHYTNATTFSAGNAITYDTYVTQGYPITMVMQDDGTNKKFGFSFNYGLNIQQVFSETHANFLTPTQVGFFVDPNGASTEAPRMDVLNWYVSTSTLF